ncbi:MAG: non-canonical purine NTP pyrophosphatase [Rhodothermaceae bacterium]|nr:MAG: non-canonical purine NTP pyrophosphatase [Rhodothermaceae bacterium]
MKQPLEIVLATRNPGKVRELRALLAGWPVVLRTAADFPGAPEVEEDAPTLEGNARKKALALHRHTGLPALADDTGLEVDALGGRPGVHSARFAGPGAGDAENRARLLQELHGVPDRTARFRTVLAFATDDGVLCFEGICRGYILEKERGRGGFGYDPLFVPEGETRTFAELSPAEKNALSHRGKALRAWLAFLQRQTET